MPPLAQDIDSNPGNGNLAPGARQPVTAVSELADVEPADWAFQAVQSLVERYGCIAGYPDGTFRGDRPLSRNEFAAGLDACLGRIEEILAESTAEAVDEADLPVIQRLQQEFGAELSLARRAIADLEARTATLKDQQFSATTLMGGEVIFGLAAGIAGDDLPGDGQDNATFAQLARLQFVSSFTGRDRLRLQLVTGNFDNQGFAGFESYGTDMARLSYQSDLDDDVILDLLDYRFAAFNDRVVLALRPVGFDLSNVLTANSPFFDTGRGAISRFAEASPLFKIGGLDSGVGFDWLMTDRVRLQAAYGVRNGGDADGGIVGNDRSMAGVQLLVKPVPTVLTGIAYLDGYADNGRLDTFTGSLNADLSGDRDAPARIRAVSGTLQWRISSQLTLSTWGGWIQTDYIDSDAEAIATTYAIALAVSDPFGREGDLLAFLAGQPPRLRAGTGVPTDPDVGFHFELFYRFQLTDNITLTPGAFLVIHPEHDRDNGSIAIATLRTTFRF